WVDHQRYPDTPDEDDIIVVRVESGLFFANADHVRESILGMLGGHTVAVVIDAETVPSIDVTAAAMLAALGDELDRRGVRLLLAKSVGQVRDVLRTAPARQRHVTLEPTIDEAVAAGRAGHRSTEAR